MPEDWTADVVGQLSREQKNKKKAMVFPPFKGLLIILTGNRCAVCGRKLIRMAD